MIALKSSTERDWPLRRRTICLWPHTVLAYVAMACIVMAYMVMAHTVMPYIVVPYTFMASISMAVLKSSADVAGLFVQGVYIVMACIVMAWPWSKGICLAGSYTDGDADCWHRPLSRRLPTDCCTDCCPDSCPEVHDDRAEVKPAFGEAILSCRP